MAFRRGRRRRPQVQWMPSLGTEPGVEGVQYPQWPAAQYDCALTVAGRDPETVVQALTWDYPTEESIIAQSAIPSLADWEQSAWRLRRIVGKLFIGYALAGAAPAVAATAGFIVLKVNEDDGTPLKAADVTAYAPDTVGSIRDPWIWRRSWILGHGFVEQSGFTSNNASLAGAPAHNMLYGSVADGPHIDAKTNRRIGPEERLFMVLTVRNLCTLSAQDNSQVYWYLDYRLLGSAMKASNRRNASR